MESAELSQELLLNDPYKYFLQKRFNFLPSNHEAISYQQMKYIVQEHVNLYRAIVLK